MADCEEQNIKKITAYFESGCKQESSRGMGLELEHFIVDKATQRSVDYYGEHGIERVLEELSPYYTEKFYSEGHLIGLMREEDTLTLEPGAQLEISISPQKEIKKVEEIYRTFSSRIAVVLEKWNYESVTLGYHPRSKIEEITMIPKERYRFMYQYFMDSGTCGKYMMKGTASTQVSIDYKDEEEFRFKYRAAYLLGPVFSLLTENTPVFEGKRCEKRLLRQYIWSHVDESRTSMPNKLFSEGFGFKDYAEYVYQVPQIVMLDDKENVLYTKKSAKEIYTLKELDEEEIEQILSMVFPDVRVKKYIEIRMADSISWEYALAYLALVKGVFMNEDGLKDLLDGFGTMGISSVEAAKNALEKDGLQAIIYGKKAAKIKDNLFAIAKEALGEEEAKYLLPLQCREIESRGCRNEI